VRRFIITISGGILCLAGVIFALVPFLPGTPLIVMGVGLLGSEFPWIRSQVARVARSLAELVRGRLATARHQQDARSTSGGGARGLHADRVPRA